MKLFGVDANSVFRQCWEAADGKDFAQARQRAGQKVLRAADGYDRIVVARDAHPSFRKGIFGGYKADRADPGEAFREQLRAFLTDMREIGATVWASPPLGELDGKSVYGEADDVLASLAAWYQDHAPDGDPSWSLRILSGDHDLWALVDDLAGIEIVNLDGKVIKVDDVVSYYGVDPPLVSESKALSGDKGDGYLGFANVGKGVAGKILKSPIQRLETDRSAADAVIRAVIAGTDPGVKLAADELASLKAGGLELLDLGRKLATLRWALRTMDGEHAPLDFAVVLEEPRRLPRQASPTTADAIAALTKPDAAPVPSAALAVAPSASVSLAPYDNEPFGKALKKTLVFAEQMFQSQLYRNMPNAAACVVLIEHSRAFGVPAVILGQHAYVPNGKISFMAQIMVAVVLRHPSTIRFRFDLKRCNDTFAVVKYGRRYPDGEEELGEYQYTIQMANNAGYTTGKNAATWAKQRANMLCWAAARECARKVWPEVTLGIRGPDEVRDGEIGDAGAFPDEMVQEEGDV